LPGRLQSKLELPAQVSVPAPNTVGTVASVTSVVRMASGWIQGIVDFINVELELLNGWNF
jgi:hypothetical protein